jgi:hypothetical protein
MTAIWDQGEEGLEEGRRTEMDETQNLRRKNVGSFAPVRTKGMG